MGILPVNQIFTILLSLLSYFKIVTKKKLNSNDQNLKLRNSICDKGTYFPMQKI